MQQFNQIVSVNFQGVVVVFGRELAGKQAIYFDVLGQDVDSTDDDLDWSGFTPVGFTEQVRQVGMSIITVDCEASTLMPSTAPFRVVTDQKYISVIQQSLSGTLYVNRFRLLKTKSGTDQKTTAYVLSPAWEVRYARSHKEDVPADKSDKQDFLDPDAQPFLEPSLELSMITGVTDGNFDALLLPISGSESFAWQLLSLDGAKTAVRLFNFPATDNGLFDVAGKPVGSDLRILPDSVFSVAKAGSTAALTITSAPRAVTYVKHEKVVQPDGSSIGVRRATRAMITLTVADGTATVDSAISVSGTMADLSGVIVTSNIVPAEFDLRFDGVSSLGLVPPGSGANPLVINGPFEITLMLAPGIKGDGLSVVAGAAQSEEKNLAPYVSIVDGDKIEVGFGNGSARVSCRTLHQVLFNEVWTDLHIQYAGKGDNPFTLTVNDSSVPLTPCTTAAEPCGTPLALVGAASKGFVGALKKLEVKVAGTSVVLLDCNSVNYSVNPPTTLNQAASAVVVTVTGARLEPSASPVNSDMSGAFYIDAMGLTYYAGLAGFIRPDAAACLIDGSDGLLHLYYQGDSSLLTVAQFSTQSARATFTVDWTTQWSSSGLRAAALEQPSTSVALYRGWGCETWAPVGARLLAAPDTTQSGFLNFVAHRVGTYMNGTQITVSASSVSELLCDISVKAAQDVGTETWHGLPRDVGQLSQIWNGAGSNNPDDPDVLNQSKPYYDYAASAPAVLIPTLAGGNGSFFLLTSVPQLPVTLTSVQVAAGATAEFVVIDVTIKAPPRWPATATLNQHWPTVPAAPRTLLDVFAGKASHYDYSAVTTTGSRAYGLPMSLARSDEQVSHVLMFVRDEQKDFSVTVAQGSRPALCNVAICGVSLTDVPREQAGFVRVLNGDDPSYPYPSGYQTGLATLIYALGNGLSADVVDTPAPAPEGGAFAYAGLLRVLFQGPSYDAPGMATQALTAAAVIQGARLAFQGRDDALRGSMLFGALIDSPPTDGGVGRLTNTSVHQDGIAPVLTPGVNGGWMPLSPSFSLDVNPQSKTNYVGFNVDKAFSPSDQLAILSDLTVETWLAQSDARINPSSRVLSYNVLGNRQHPDLPVQYMIGARQGPGLVMNDSTYVSRSFNFKPPALSLQVYLYLSQSNLTGIVLTVSQVRGSARYVQLSLDEYGKAVLTFLQNAGQVQTAQPLPVGAWVCLTAVVADAGQGQVTLKLSVNADAPVKATVANSFSGDLGALMLGDNQGNSLPARVNGVAFWQRALSDSQMQNSYRYGFADTDSMLGIRWNLAEGSGVAVVNSAATGIEYDATVINPSSPGWDVHGAFQVPYAGRNDLVLTSNRILKGWTHVALASSQGHGLKLLASNYGKVTDGDGFNPSSTFALETWVAPSALNRKQVLLEKNGSYSLYINTLGQVCLTVQLQRDGSKYDDPPINFTHEVKFAITAGVTTYVAVNFSTGTVANDSGSKDYVAQKYFVRAGLYLNGTRVAEQLNSALDQPATVRTRTSSYYVGVNEDLSFNFEGLISHVRVWNRNLTTDQIAQTYALRLTPTAIDGLVAGWDFDEMTGTTAQDLTGNNTLVLTSNQLWTIWQDVAQANLIVNGRRSLPLRLTVADVGGYQDSQFTFGGALQGSNLTLPYSGQIDDVRLFSTRLTEQQIRESMNKALTGGEDHLAAYWRIEAGSGPTLYDMTGYGNNGTLLPAANPPLWKNSSAPIQNEAQYVVNALGGTPNYFVAQIQGQPSVIEYASAERDAYGKVFSVMKRGYFYESSDGVTALEVGYKVGDLDTLFVGQVQSKPTIIGFIEGGPPLPSENQTLAYWVGDGGGPAPDYASACSVTYQESETKSWTFTGNKTSTFNGEFNLKGGLYQKSKSDVSVGLGAEAETMVLETTITGGAKMVLSGNLGDGLEVSQNHSSSVSLSTSMTPSGSWEAANALLNPVVGRRYIQNNVGIALVKSSTADLYMQALKGTQTPVGYVLAPNTTIPVDTNIIDFPINPRYVKNGTLDGKVGLVNDPDYPEANDERGSYFKPLEAYGTKRKIEKQEQQLKAYYDQFDVSKYRTVAAMDSLRDKLKSNQFYDFANQKNLRSLYNNYVWTAAGGLHKEEHSFANSYSETYSGTSTLTFAAGLEFKADIGTPFGGYYIEADTLLGNTWTMTATKVEALSNGFALSCSVTPTNFLPAPILTQDGNNLKFSGYGANAAPGKVDAYRYMSFLLAPAADNFAALSQVVDANWLNNSTTASAAAMREAMNNPSEPWRVMYRTTYVSRVPAAFQPVKADTNAPNITPPANLPSNYWLVTVIEKQLNKPDPTRLEIGTAIDTVLGSPGAAPGLLKDLIPWWTAFYSAAKVYGTDEFLELAELRVDLLNYMASKYEADNYRNS
ncbi:hypothetical protein HKK55_06475 [Pseudomonas sp. ADAK18]|uniref:LamG-like jellyroll fold domain-containing protein n=1 Tax=Pseudomonas sp. ADAK18 TaxID=2730848 RepID=UPI001462C8F5|nr:LamG-like jellyroll fold domain-containing protein [Pseudomonas sp. ADAK18]QJI28371.1 hypothetical protein HKK55_06475 [Pseudomonas sp. ADAK18]